LNGHEFYLTIIAIQEKLSEIIEKSNEASINVKVRDEFEQQVCKTIEENLLGNQNEIIKKYKIQNKMTNFYKIVSEEKLSDNYCYLRILRISEFAPIMDIEKVKGIQEKCPLLIECIEKIKDINLISNLKNILNFINELTPYVESKIARKEAENISISKFIEYEIPKDQQKIVKILFQNFKTSWTTIETIKNQFKDFGEIISFSEETPIIGFLIDGQSNSNKVGKNLCEVINDLCKRQNSFLGSIKEISKKLYAFKNLVFFGEDKILPQNSLNSDILDFTYNHLVTFVSEGSSINPKYGYGVLVYDYEAIELNIMDMLMKKKIFIIDLSFYRNVNFQNEVKMKSSRCINQLKRMGLDEKIQNERVLDEKLMKFSFSEKKLLLISLEKIIYFFTSFKEKNITLAEYISTYFSSTFITPILTEEIPFNEYRIEILPALYEYIELKAFPDILKNSFYAKNQEKLSNVEKEQISNFLKKINCHPSLNEIITACTRFISRYYLSQDFKKNHTISFSLVSNEDLWSYPKNEVLIKTFEQEFPSIVLDKICDCREELLEALNEKDEDENCNEIMKMRESLCDNDNDEF